MYGWILLYKIHALQQLHIAPYSHLHTGAFINNFFLFSFSCVERKTERLVHSCYMAASFHPATLLFFRIKDHYYVNNSSFWTMPPAKAPTNKVFYLTQSQYSVWCITILFSRPVFFSLLFFLIWFDFKILYTQTITGDYNMFWSFSLLLYMSSLCFRTWCMYSEHINVYQQCGI